MGRWLVLVLLWVWGCTEGNPDADAPDAVALDAVASDATVIDMATADRAVDPPDAAPRECNDGDREADYCVGGGERTRFCVNGRWGEWVECPPCADGSEDTRPCGINERGMEVRFCVDGSFSEWSACADPDVCVDGQQEGEACGVAGTRQRVCAAGQWGDFGPCMDMAECVDGDRRTEACGLNGNGTRVQDCVAGQFGEWSECDDPDECLADSVEESACGVASNGVRARTCLDGRWTAFGPCDDPDLMCDGGARITQACGLNGRGEQRFECADGRLVADGACDDPDACIDAAIAREACGINGAGQRTRTCEAGQWGMWSACDDPDECIADAMETMICGLNGRGEARRRCLDGRWSPWEACADPDECTDDVVEALGGACGLNGRGERTRRCDAGQWVERCADPDECEDGAEDARACGDGGQRRRTCAEGRWGPFDRCDAANPCPDVENPECGPPGPERCNGLDDDHDGAADEGLLLAPGDAPVPTDFDIQVDAAIDAGLGWLRTQIRENGDAPDNRHSALAALALMERRDGVGLGEPVGYAGLDAADKDRVRRLLSATFRAERALGDPDETPYTYVAGSAVMALAVYLQTGGPDVIDPDLDVGARQGLTNLIRALLAQQGADGGNDGGWNYRQPTANGDTSTTHFVINGLAAALPIRAAGQAGIDAVLPFLESVQKADGGGAYNRNSQSSSSMSASVLWMYRLAGLPPGDARVDALLDWLADPFSADRMVGPFTPTSVYYYFWAASKGFGVSVDRLDPRFVVRDPADLEHPDVAGSWYFEFATSLLDWQDPDGAWGTSHNGSTRGWSQMSSHLFALLTLERSFGGVRPPGGGQGFAPQCLDEIDNDGDGLVDADDPECLFRCTPLERPVPACANARDDDGDGRIDLDDPGCVDRLDDAEEDAACGNGVDDDADGVADWPADPGCRAADDPSEADPVEAPACSNGRDDDEDGQIDFGDDPGCLSAGQDSERIGDCPALVGPLPYGVTEVFGEVAAGDGVLTTRCGGRGNEFLHVLQTPTRLRVRIRVESEAFDPVLGIRRGCSLDAGEELRCAQDVDAQDPSAQLDWVFEPGTWYVHVDSNFGAGPYRMTLEYLDPLPAPACSNGVDDDGDLRIDLADPGCEDAADRDEAGLDAVCANGIDDDGDGLTDWPTDPGCLAAGDSDETTPDPPPPCSNGRDDDGDGLTDFPADSSCFDAAGESEFGGARR